MWLEVAWRRWLKKDGSRILVVGVVVVVVEGVDEQIDDRLSRESSGQQYPCPAVYLYFSVIRYCSGFKGSNVLQFLVQVLSQHTSKKRKTSVSGRSKS